VGFGGGFDQKSRNTSTRYLVETEVICEGGGRWAVERSDEERVWLFNEPTQSRISPSILPYTKINTEQPPMNSENGPSRKYWYASYPFLCIPTGIPVKHPWKFAQWKVPVYQQILN
jgi:hypothetical protein